MKFSSKPQEKAPLEAAHKELTFEQRAKLVQHLLAIPSIADGSRRATVIDELPAKIKTNVAYNSVANIHVLNLVNTCLQYLNGMQELRDILQFFEDDSIPMQKLKLTLNRLLPKGLGFDPNDDQGLIAEAQTEKWLHQEAQESMSDRIKVDPLGELRLPFANRERELESICGPESPQHIQIHAPSGYGKTELLQKVKAHYEQKGWQVVWVDFSSPEHTGCAENKLALVAEVARQSGLEQLTSQTPIDAVLELVKHWVNEERETLLLFDSLQYVTDRQMQIWMKKEFFRSLSEMSFLKTLPPKVVAAGHIPAPKWAGYTKPYFHFHPLIPLDNRKIVKQLLHDLLKIFKINTDRFKSEWFDGMSREILHLTKGHAKCMATILLSFLAKMHFLVSVNQFMTKRAQIFHEYVKPILENEILVAAKKDDFLYQMLLTMSVLRGINLEVIQYLNQQGLIRPISPSPAWPRTLLRNFIKLNILQNNGSLMYSWETMIRQLLALQLSLTDPQLYWTVHEVAAKMIDEWIRGEDESGRPLPIRLADNMQTDAIREGLYHHAQLFARASHFTVADELEAKLKNAYLPYLRTSLGEDISRVAKRLLNALQKDTELKNLIVSIGGEEAFARLLEPARELAEAEHEEEVCYG